MHTYRPNSSPKLYSFFGSLFLTTTFLGSKGGSISEQNRDEQKLNNEVVKRGANNDQYLHQVQFRRHISLLMQYFVHNINQNKSKRMISDVRVSPYCYDNNILFIFDFKDLHSSHEESHWVP